MSTILGAYDRNDEQNQAALKRITSTTLGTKTALDVNLITSDIQIGAVEIKDGDADTRAAVDVTNKKLHAGIYGDNTSVPLEPTQNDTVFSGSDSDAGITIYGVSKLSNGRHYPWLVDATGAGLVDVSAGKSFTPGIGAANLGKAEDSQHTTGSTGVMALGVRNDNLATSRTSANSDYSAIATDIKGAVYTKPDDIGLDIAMGNRNGTTFIHKFGEAPDFDTGDGEITVWDGADDALGSGPAMVYTYSATADIGLISSSNTGDTQDVEIQGLDSNYDLVTQTITLTGQTDVDISGVGGTDLIRVFRIKNVGSTNFAGDVYIRTNGSGQSGGVPTTPNTIRAVVKAKNNQTLMAVYTVPNGKTAYMRCWYAATAGGIRATNYKIRVAARPFGGVFQLKHVSALSSTGTSYIQHSYNEPEVFAAKTDIEITAETTAASITESDVSAGFDLVLVDN